MRFELCVSVALAASGLAAPNSLPRRGKACHAKSKTMVIPSSPVYGDSDGPKTYGAEIEVSSSVLYYGGHASYGGIVPSQLVPTSSVRGVPVHSQPYPASMSSLAYDAPHAGSESTKPSSGPIFVSQLTRPTVSPPRTIATVSSSAAAGHVSHSSSPVIPSRGQVSRSSASPDSVHSSTKAFSASQTSSVSGTKTFTWPKATSWIDWKTYKSNGVNIGSWLEQEFNQDTVFWQNTAPDYADEWSWCEGVGFDVCGPILEERYASWITTALIDKLAATDINTLRIPLTYAAFTRVPGSWLYTGNQKQHLRKIVNYAIEQYDMHVIISLHSLPGGYNTLQIGEAFGHNNWWHNATLLDYTYKAVDGALDFIVSTGHKDRITFGPFNEASDDFSGFGSPAGLTESGREYILQYVEGVKSRVDAIDSRIPIMFQDSFSGMEAWSSSLEERFGVGANIVIDTHNYWFAAAGAYSNWLDPAICGQAAFNPGDGKFPVFIGEWSLQTMYNNTLEGRQNLFDRQRWAFQHYSAGGTFWTAKFAGLDAVDGEGTQQDYWSYERLIDADIVTPMPANASYCD